MHPDLQQLKENGALLELPRLNQLFRDCYRNRDQSVEVYVSKHFSGSDPHRQLGSFHCDSFDKYGLQKELHRELERLDRRKPDGFPRFCLHPLVRFRQGVQVPIAATLLLISHTGFHHRCMRRVNQV